MPEIKVNVRPWTDDPTCPKCLRTCGKTNDGIGYNHIEDGPFLLMICRRCGWAWVMEPAYKTWKKYDKELGDVDEANG